MVTQYLVFIKKEQLEKAEVGISTVRRMMPASQTPNFRIIYFEKFTSSAKAMKRKTELERLTDNEKVNLAKVKNPEMLNLSFTIHDL